MKTEPAHVGPAAALPPELLASGPPRNFLGALRNREFTLFWSGQAISQTGTWMQQFAQGWVVTTLASSALALASVNLAASIPILILTPFGGVAADRVDRRRILLLTQTVLAVLAIALGVLIRAGHIQLWHIWLIAPLLGVATAYDLPAYQSFFPQLVDKEDLPDAIALNQATFHGSRIIGPAVASWLVAQWGTAAAFFANGASFLAVIGSLLLIQPKPASGGATVRTRLLMTEGVEYVREHPHIIALLGLTIITTLFVFPNAATLMPFYAYHVLRVGPGGLGVIMAISGGGAFLGAMFLRTLARTFRIRWILTALFVMPIAVFGLAWSHTLALSVAAEVILSFCVSSTLGLASTMVQESVPDGLRGRVMSLYSLAFTGVAPFAALAAARLADLIGMRRELIIAAVLYKLCGILLIPMLRKSNREDRFQDC
ncbi:MAG: MFS transporter [Bryobacteraceae bacterium]